MWVGGVGGPTNNLVYPNSSWSWVRLRLWLGCDNWKCKHKTSVHESLSCSRLLMRVYTRRHSYYTVNRICKHKTGVFLGLVMFGKKFGNILHRSILLSWLLRSYSCPVQLDIVKTKLFKGKCWWSGIILIQKSWKFQKFRVEFLKHYLPEEEPDPFLALACYFKI